MSRTMSILFGMGLASLALMGCSKNNIVGPETLTDNQNQAALERPAAMDRRILMKMAVPGEESQAGYRREETGRLVQLEEFELLTDHSAVRIEGRPVALPTGGKVVLEGRPAAAPTGGRAILENRPMPVPTSGGWLFLEGRPAAVPIGDKVILEGRAMAAPDRIVLEEQNF